MSKFVVIFKRFERFWHWMQALLIVTLIITGLEVHNVINLFGFEQSVELHNIAGFAWVALVVLIYTWIFTTGDWQQYFPSSFSGTGKVIRFYMFGVFKGEQHPHHMSADDKFNPLQRLGYIVVLFVIVPLQVITGLIFYFFPELRTMGVLGNIEFVAILHTLNSYIIFAFLIMHLYLITFGKKLTSHLKTMLTGKEEIK